MSKDVHIVETPFAGERKISIDHEDETDSCPPKSDILLQSSSSANAESTSTEQPVCLLQHEAIAVGNSDGNATSQHHTKVSKETGGGWGYLIVIGVFFITSLQGGVAISFSLLYLEFIELFSTSKAVAGWIGSLFMFVSNVFGINSCYLFSFNLLLLFCANENLEWSHCCFDADCLVPERAFSWQKQYSSSLQTFCYTFFGCCLLILESDY